MRSVPLIRAAVAACLVPAWVAASASAFNPFASQVVEYISGSGVSPDFNDPDGALGSPTRFTGVASGFPSVVSPFSPPFDPGQLVQIGEGGSLTLRLATPARNNPGNPFGVDLIVFGNGGFIDTSFPNGVVSAGAGMFGLNPMTVEVSANGVDFVSLGVFTEGLFPTMGYLDAGAFDSAPGSVLTSFTTPVNPALTRLDFAGLDMDGIRALYAGSGGGTPIDIGASGLDLIHYVRILNPLGSGVFVEIDAIAVVPAPGGIGLLTLGGLLASRRRRGV